MTKTWRSTSTSSAVADRTKSTTEDGSASCTTAVSLWTATADLETGIPRSFYSVSGTYANVLAAYGDKGSGSETHLPALAPHANRLALYARAAEEYAREAEDDDESIEALPATAVTSIGAPAGRLDQMCAEIGEHAEIPPPEVLTRTATPDDVKRYPAYFIMGAGREAAQNTRCGHGYYLTDSCP